MLRRDLFFFNCVGDRINCWRNCYIPSCFSRLSVTGFYFCFPILTWFQARFFSYGASFSYFLYAFLSAVTIGMYLCVQINLCMLSARTCVKLIASQHLFNGHVTWSMFLTLEEIFLYIHNQKCQNINQSAIVLTVDVKFFNWITNTWNFSSFFFFLINSAPEKYQYFRKIDKQKVRIENLKMVPADLR